MELPKFALFKGRIVPYAEARVGILTHTFNYGTGVFGGIRGYWNEEERELFVFRPDDHFCRFLESARLLFMNFSYSKEDLTRFMMELIRAENLQHDCYIRPFAYYADEGIGVAQAGELTPEISMAVVPFETPRRYAKGLHVAVSSWRRVDDTMIPARGKIAGTYVNSTLAKTDAMRAGFDDALFLNADGHVSEGSVTNFFMVRNGIVRTPPVTENILEGITRRSLLTLLKETLNVPVEERPIDRSEVYLAEEAFLCGTATQIAPITKIDHRLIGTGIVGPFTSALRELYDGVVHSREKRYESWCAPVYAGVRLAATETTTRVYR